MGKERLRLGLKFVTSLLVVIGIQIVQAETKVVGFQFLDNKLEESFGSDNGQIITVGHDIVERVA